MIKTISQKYQNKEVMHIGSAIEETNLNRIVRLDLCLGRIKDCNVRLIFILISFTKLNAIIRYTIQPFTE